MPPDVDMQTWINIIATIAIGVGGWFGRSLWDAVDKLKNDLHQLEVDLPSNYIQRDQFSEGMKEIKEMLIRISDKLDGKADKS
jgi:hypothetical protein